MVRGLMSDAEWAFFEPFVVETGPRRGRRPRDHRLVLDGVFWIARTGAAWRDLHSHFGTWNSVYRQFRRWTQAGTWDVPRRDRSSSWRCSTRCWPNTPADRQPAPGTSQRLPSGDGLNRSPGGAVLAALRTERFDDADRHDRLRVRPTFRPEADRPGDPAEPPAGTDGRVNACGAAAARRARSGVEATGRLRSSKVMSEGPHGSACQTMLPRSLSCTRPSNAVFDAIEADGIRSWRTGWSERP